ncbi:MAG: hypothetical protein ACO3JT_09735 [Candidatus Nanopelagicales bacterium]
MGLRPKSIALTGAIALVASTIGMGVVAPAAQAEERLPATDFRPCTVAGQFYCVESVVFEIDGLPAQTGVWVPTGQPIPVSDDTSIAPVVPGIQPTTPKVTFPGRWSFAGFPVDLVGYDGIYVQVGPTSTASDFAWVRMQPASARADGTIGRAVAAEGSDTPRDLDGAMKLTVNIRFGPLEPTANVMVADGSIARSGTEGANNITFSGYPVQVARQSSTRDCEGETGKALDVVRQMYAFVVFGNTRQSFGYDGMSGDLSVSTNGTCFITTPSYNAATGEFSFQASAPHFAPDGVQVNRGFYIATIPLQDAALLFGITDPKQVKAALEVFIETEDGVEQPVARAVSVRRGVISVSITNFQFSRPTITVKVKEKLWKKKYKKAAKKNRNKAKA